MPNFRSLTNLQPLRTKDNLTKNDTINLNK